MRLFVEECLSSWRLFAVLCVVAVAACTSPSGDEASSAGRTAVSVGSGAGGSATGDASASGGTGASCNETAYPGKVLASDLVVVLKASGTAMLAEPELTGALNQFVVSPGMAGSGLGLSFFPRHSYSFETTKCHDDCTTGAWPAVCGLCDPTCSCFILSCDPADYYGWLSTPELGTQSTAFVTLPARPFDLQPYLTLGETAMAPAMTGAKQSLSGWALTHRDQNVAIVLVSDSDAVSDPCPGTVLDVAVMAATAAADKAAIRTYVVTLGTVPALGAIAAAGGSVDAQKVTVADVGTALSKVVQQMRACAYSIPVPSTGSFDPDKANVHVQGTADGDRLARLPSASDCAGARGGWYYDDPADPRKIVLCHESCANLGEASKGIDVLLGCPTIVASD